MRSAIARALGRHLVRIMPSSRADWAAGMKAEIEAIDDPAGALAFAWGCVLSGYTRQFRTVPGTLAAMRWSVAVMTLLCSALVLAHAGRSVAVENHEFLPHLLAGLGLAFLVAGLALIRFGPGVLASISASMLALNTLGLWVTGQTTFIHADFHRALIIEGYLLWSMLLVAGLTLRHAARSPRLAKLARDHGWNG